MQRTSHTRGLTFFEVLIVMGIFAIVGGFVLFVSMDTFRGSSFRSDRDILIAALQRARAQAINNVCLSSVCTDGKPHGVHIQPNAFTIFQGSVYDPADTYNVSLAANPLVIKSGLTDVVFSQLSAATAGGTIDLNGSGHDSTITIGTEGQITWTN